MSSTLTAVAGDPMDEDRTEKNTIDPIFEIRYRLEKIERDLIELRLAVANRIMVEPRQPAMIGGASTLTGLPPSNRRLI